MMLDYDWTNNPAAAAAAMMLFGEETNTNHVDVQNSHHYNNQMFMNHYNNMDYFQQAHDHHQGIPTTALFSNVEYVGCHHPLVPVASRIGLDLGIRTYFATGPEENERGRRNSNMNMMIGRRRRRRIARCQAEGCGKDLTLAKHYHRRHKVCEYHSKASMVVTAGLSQRFCQQCSRFHILSEFDQGKRSCRKRLADHNRRRRKSQDLTTTSTSMSINTNPINNNNNDTTSSSTTILIGNKSKFNSENLQIEIGTKLTEACSSVTTHHDPQVHLDIFPAPQMELGLTASSSAVSTTCTTMQQNKSCNLSKLREYRELGNRIPASWVDDEAEEMYHNK